MPLMPEEPISVKLESMMLNQSTESLPRPYLGYSGVGGACKRHVWYSFRWVALKKLSVRLKHLFSLGDWEENNLIEMLESIGATVHDEQLEVVGTAKHVKGHIDCLVSNLPFFKGETLLGEFKTANDKNFKEFKAKGVKLKNPGYYAQMNAYMGHLKLKNAIFIVRNKNDSNIYIEIVPFSEDEWKKIRSTEMELLSSDDPPERIGGRTWFECKFCDHQDICHYGVSPLKNCRTCKEGTIVDDGKWECGLTGEVLSIDDQRLGCEKYCILKGLINE